MKFLSKLSILFMGLIAAVLFLGVLGLRINTSDSIPKGIYWLSQDRITTGKYVLFCPENSELMREARNRGVINQGLCPGGLTPMMKRVVAMSGDVVTSAFYGVVVNNLLLPLSEPQPVDEMNWPLPQWRVTSYQLKEQEVLVMTDQSPWSFDSRYFGVLKLRQIKGVIKPLWTWPLMV